MKKSSLGAAIALSLLVFPGSGHFVMKRWLRGTLWGFLFGLPLLVALLLVATILPKLFDNMMSPTGDVLFEPQKMIAIVALCAVSFLFYGLAALDCWWVWRSLPPAAPQEEPSAPGDPA